MNRRLVGFAAAAVALVVLWWVLLWGPRSRAIGQARERAASAETERSALTARIQRLKEAQADEPRQRARLEALRTAIPDEPDLGQFILDANDAAVRSGIDFISIAPMPPSAPGPGTAAGTAATTAAPPAGGSAALGAGAPAAAPAQVTLALQVGGGYFQVLDFLNRLDALPRLVVTDGLTVTSDDKAKLTVGVNARMFVRSVPPAYVAPAGGAGALGAAPAAPAPSSPPATSPPATASPPAAR